MSFRRPSPLFLVLLLAFALLTSASAQTYVQLILDASGSMFNRLEDGRYRIVAAKDVLSGFIANLPDDPQLNVGLRVYGSRLDALHPNACDDTHLLVAMRGVDREALLATVRDVQARGATPIARSLALAGGDFSEPGRYLIVLVTDGEESCGGDVRGVLDDLAARGIDIDLRIVGFDLTPFASASFAGLGTFENARSAEELAAALGRAVEAVVVAGDERFAVEARVTRAGAAAEDGVVVTFVDAVDGSAVRLALAAPGRFTTTLPAGAFVAEIDDAFGDALLRIGGLTVRPDTENRFAFDVAPEAAVTLDVAPHDPVAGSSVDVRFAGAPVAGRHVITLVPVDAADEAYTSTASAEGTSGEVGLLTPSTVATLEARYLLTLPEGGSRVIGRSQPFTTVLPLITLEAAAEVAGGSPFEVAWTGPDNVDDYLTIVPSGAPAGAYLSYAYTARGNPSVLRAPHEPGAYELRYTSEASRGQVLASRPISVVASAYGLDAPDEIGTGAPLAVAWTGPDNPSDYVTIVPEGAPTGTYTSYAYTARGNPAELLAPTEPGRYELRYTTDAAGSPTLASRPILVVASSYRVDAPTTVEAGAPFEVAWTGPDNPSDYITIVPEGAPTGTYTSYAYTARGNPARIHAPVAPGRYEVRYTTDQSGNPTFASQFTEVVPAQVTLTPPARIVAGEPFEVAWTGPDGDGDYITIVPADAPPGTYASYGYTGRGSPVRLQAPEAPGAFELRYQSDRESGVFFRLPVRVE